MATLCYVTMAMAFFVTSATESNIRWQHAVQQHVSLLLFLHQLTSSIRDHFFQVVGIFLHHSQHVVHYVVAPEHTKHHPAVHIILRLPIVYAVYTLVKFVITHHKQQISKK